MIFSPDEALDECVMLSVQELEQLLPACESDLTFIVQGRFVTA